MTKRGEPLPINQALNRPRAKLGLDLSAWMTIVFVCVTVCGHGSAHDCPSEDGLIPQPKEIDMPLLEVTQTRHISASIRLTDTTALQVDQYAAFIHASANDVVEHALAYVFSKDRDFQEYLKSSEAQSITPTLRIRRAPAPDAVELPAKKPASAASSATAAGAMAGGTKA